MPNTRALILYTAASMAPSLVGAASLQDLFDGDCLAMDGVTACDWGLEYDLSDVAIDPSLIDVILEERPGSFGMMPTISYEFNDQLLVSDGQGILFGFYYSMYVHGGAYAAEMTLTDPIFVDDTGLIRVSESVFADDVLIAELVAELDPAFGIEENPVTALFDGSFKYLWKETDIEIQSVDGTVGLGDLHQARAPAPATLGLFAGGLLGMAAMLLRGRRPRRALGV